jgi:hypothetical protein
MTYCDECKERLYPMNPELAFYSIRLNRYLTPLCQGCPYEYDNKQEKIINTVEDRIANLESITAEHGRVPRQFHDSLQQVQGHVLHLQKKVTEIEQALTNKGHRAKFR